MNYGILNRPMIVVLVVFYGLMTAPAVSLAAEGDALIDKATDLKLEAKNFDDLEQVAKLCEEALAKGVSDDNKEFAIQLLAGTLLERANQMARAILGERPDNRWPSIRKLIMEDMGRILKHDAKHVDALLLQARLQLLPGGQAQLALDSVEIIFNELEDDDPRLAEAYLVQASLQKEPEQRLASLNKALDVDPEHSDARQQRAFINLGLKNFEDAIKDLETILEIDTENMTVAVALAEALVQSDKFDDAIAVVDGIIKVRPKNSAGYELKAELYLTAEKFDEAIEQLNKAIEINPKSVSGLLTRARLSIIKGETKDAKEDIGRVQQLQPNSPQALLLLSAVYEQEEKYGDAARLLEQLLEFNPANTQLRMQLAMNYSMGDFHDAAIDEFSKVIRQDPKNWLAKYSRADTYLNVGKHKEAIADYEAALEINREYDNLLNNLAWVLSTSPVDDVRDGKRAVELALKACEVSNYEKPHILSTLAAAYAESGDFKNAVKWANKAVEIGREDIQEQLEHELKSYSKKKPWRENKGDDAESKEKPKIDRSKLKTL